MSASSRPAPRPLSSPITSGSGVSISNASPPAATGTGGLGRLPFTQAASASSGLSNGGRLAVAHLSSPPPTKMAAPSTSAASSPVRQHPWSPPTRGPAAAQTAQSPPRRTTTAASSYMSRMPPPSVARSPTRATAVASALNASGSVSSPPSKPVASLLDSMSELRALIAKKEMELSSIAAAGSGGRGTGVGMASSTSVAAAASRSAGAGVSMTPLAMTTPSQFHPLATPSPHTSTSRIGSPRTQPAGASTYGGHLSPMDTAALSSSLSSSHAAQSSHAQNVRDQEVHEYSIRILSLEQTLMEREETFQQTKLELERLKQQYEATKTDLDVRSQSHRKQVELLQSNIENLTWNRHASLESQRAEFERLRKELLEEVARKEQASQSKISQLNNTILSYEEKMRAQIHKIEEAKEETKKEKDKAAQTIQQLELEVANLKSQKASTKDQLNSGVKQQLALTSNLKALSRRLEEQSRHHEAARIEWSETKTKLEDENDAIRREMNAKNEELLNTLRQVENQLAERERQTTQHLHDLELSRAEEQRLRAQEREELLDAASREKRALVEDYEIKLRTVSKEVDALRQAIQQMETTQQEQRARTAQEMNHAQESWNNLVLEKEKTLQSLRMEHVSLQNQLSKLREEHGDTENELSLLRVQLAEASTDLKHARANLDDSHQRMSELRTQTRRELDEKSHAFEHRIDELTNRLLELERDNADKDRALEASQLKVVDLTNELAHLRAQSEKAARAAEVARSLEAQALLGDFASQLSRVKQEITTIKTRSEKTPKEIQRDWNRQKCREEERQRVERERSRERSRERMRSPQPRSITTMPLHPSPASTPIPGSAVAPSALNLSTMSSMAGSIGPTSPTRTHLRVRPVSGAGLGTSSYPAQTPIASSAPAPTPIATTERRPTQQHQHQQYQQQYEITDEM